MGGTPASPASANGHVRGQPAQGMGVFQALWCTEVWRLIPFLVIYSVGMAMVFPITPTLMTNGFASLAAGHPVDCSTYGPHDAPTECNDAHSTAAYWMSCTNFVSSSLLTFFCAPYVGHLSDVIGRKPFMLLGVTLGLLPIVVLQAHVHGLLPIYWYFPASALNGVISSFNMCLTSVADMIELRHRATSVGYLTSGFSVGILIGPALGGYLDTVTVLWACLAMVCCTLLYIALFVPECAPRVVARRQVAAATAAAAADASGKKSAAAAAADAGSLRDPEVPFLEPAGAEEEGGAPAACPAYKTAGQGDGGGCAAAAAGNTRDSSGSALAGIASGWAVISGSSFYLRIAAIWIVVSMTWEGAGELLFQYLQIQLQFKTVDQAHVLEVMAVAGLAVKLALLPWLVRVLGERRLLLLGLGAYSVEVVALALAPSKLAAKGAVAIGSLAGVCWPALVALQTSAVDPGRVGAVSGALQGLSALASGVGPLGFAAVFAAFTRSDSRLPRMPQMVWYFAAALSLVAMGVAATLPKVLAPQPPHEAGAGPAAPGGGRGAGSGGRPAEGRERAAGQGEEGREEGDGLRQPLLAVAVSE